MGPPDRQVLPFVAYLQGFVERGERAPLAALRRGLGKQPGAAPEMFPYVVPWVPQDASPWQEEPYYLVASLFAYWHQGMERLAHSPGNLGASFARVAALSDSESVQHRFVALLNSHRDDLPDHLRQAIGLLRGKEVPVDWSQLLRDIRYWDHDERFVQRAWASSYWGQHQPDQQGTAGSAVAEPESDPPTTEQVKE